MSPQATKALLPSPARDSVGPVRVLGVKSGRKGNTPMGTQAVWRICLLPATVATLSVAFGCAGRPRHDAEDIQKGRHCLSNADGSHPAFVERVKNRLNDPDSFTHDETLVLPVDENDLHYIEMAFRATNKFGGVVRSSASGAYRNSDCTIFTAASYDPTTRQFHSHGSGGIEIRSR